MRLVRLLLGTVLGMVTLACSCGGAEEPEESWYSNCGDGLDNDGDDLTDCEEADCLSDCLSAADTCDEEQEKYCCDDDRAVCKEDPCTGEVTEAACEDEEYCEEVSRGPACIDCEDGDWTRSCDGGDIVWRDPCGTDRDSQECGSGVSCEDGQCCTPEADVTCSGDDVFWLDACGNLGELKEECALGDGCENGECCESHTDYECYDGDVYWYDACGNREGIKESCDSDEECGSGACHVTYCDFTAYLGSSCGDVRHAQIRLDGANTFLYPGESIETTVGYGDTVTIDCLGHWFEEGSSDYDRYGDSEPHASSSSVWERTCSGAAITHSHDCVE